MTKTFLIITVKNKTPESLSEAYGFSDKQNKYLSELLSPSFDSFWQGILTRVPSSSTDLVEIAQVQLGNVGGKPYWSWYGFDSRVTWCASWCADHAGIVKKVEKGTIFTIEGNSNDAY